MAEAALARAKKRHATNLSDTPEEAIDHTSDAACNPILSNVQIPDINRITHSLQKIDFIISTAHMLWQKNAIAEQVIADTVEIINHVCQKKFSFYNGKALKCMVAGLFYILGFRYNAPKKQREIGIALQITDVTLRSSYKKWLKTFPDLFQDVITMINQKPCHCMIGSG
jgi:transcription initiation factor TFIIIB Brf1 subunit/transcription initiation factor TFIIB